MLSREEEKALCFYEGDVEQTGDPFFSDAKAYVTWNALLFDGMAKMRKVAERHGMFALYFNGKQWFE